MKQLSLPSLIAVNIFSVLRPKFEENIALLMCCAQIGSSFAVRWFQEKQRSVFVLSGLVSAQQLQPQFASALRYCVQSLNSCKAPQQGGVSALLKIPRGISQHFKVPLKNCLEVTAARAGNLFAITRY